ncbi:MAG: arginine--tRNA ligase [Spirochaetaceae bacterium]|nr:arginine--tRNA ligase [Myxococcales bacterium]MCB9723751.1 arginine--tRNA ligase [Spirochaetaceae bacterium]HPG25745.1 arginine--tRNA ligase [Myxococcota bacterium]
MKEALRERIEAALRALLVAAGDEDALPEFAIEVPRQKEHGDFSCNAAMLLAKRLGRKPREIAEELRERLGDAGGLVAGVEVAGPGFLNVRLAESGWQDLLHDMIAAGAHYGRAKESGAPRPRVQVEFVSANPTGPLSTGHGRQAVLGDCIARLLEATGCDVTREYYFNDGGRQMRVLGDSVKARYLEQLGRAASPTAEALADPEQAWAEERDGLPVVFPKDGYQGDYISQIAASLVEREGESLVDEPGEGRFREEAQRVIFEDIEGTLTRIGIHFDVYYNERSLYDEGKIEETIADLRAAGLVYDADGAVWLKATARGLDRDRVVVKSTGEPTYLLPDIAYHREKFRRGFDRVIDVQGADHIEQFPFVREAAAVLGIDPGRIELVMHQFVTITSGGERVKQSTRRATFVTVDELVDDVGADVFRFFMIERKPDGHLDFDLDLAKDKNWRKNPAYYVQYAHARTHGIERKAREAGVAMPRAHGFDSGRLVLPEEIELVKKLATFPEVVTRAAESREPHHVAYYLREVAGLWNPYLQDGDRHRVLSEDEGLSAARLGLALAVRNVLASGLDLLGVGAPERM